MTKSEMVKTLKEKAGLTTLAQAEAAYDGLFALIGTTLKEGGSVNITGFGSFKVVERQARKGRNPQTGKEINIPAKKTVKFTPHKGLKDIGR